ncbi:carboxymuconolactone decarboxylase family protein [Paenibacillus camelliae]|uniref:carboxymuconolactone decarboxylase family protein n=1 Tax=Paenibacillus camelliae TaxID=512410 RepID=UPI00203ABBEF|nr:carboxymuconolactone decarboxylase family protein [Paenibacillus camelliae]MCM3634266.1 carboxymuconolactone decarboxylase family protein [Paenibacillus camelliae]
MSRNIDSYNKGMDILHEMVGADGTKPIEAFKNFYPDFADFLISFGFGEIYSREALDLKQRETITLTALISQGAFEQMGLHLNAALNVGMKPKEIVELVIHCAAYVGFPKACSAMVQVMNVFEQRGIKEIS